MTLVTVAVLSLFPPPPTSQPSSVAVAVSQDGRPDVEMRVGGSPFGSS